MYKNLPVINIPNRVKAPEYQARKDKLFPALDRLRFTTTL
jgi:hypothetical protein